MFLAGFEVLFSLFAKPGGLASPITLASSLAASSGIWAAALAAAWFVVRLCGGKTDRALAGTVVFFVGSVAQIQLAGVMGTARAHTVRGYGQASFTLVVILALSLLLVGSVRAVLFTAPTRFAVASAALAVPACSLEALIGAWILIYSLGAHLSFGSSLAVLATLGAIAFTLRAFWRVRVPAALRANLACFLLVLLMPLLLAGVSSPHREAASSVQPRAIERIVLITIDAQRADDLSCYAPGGTPTPRIDGLARDGALFENAYASAPWTQASIASMVTGLSPYAHGVVDTLARVPESAVTLAERMADQGYLTAGFVSNPLLVEPWGFSQGFGEYHGFPRPWLGSSVGAWIVGALRGSDVTPASQTDMVLGWLDGHRSTPFFLWVHYLDPHLPYAPPPEFLPKRVPGSAIGDSFVRAAAVRAGALVLSAADREQVRALYRAETRFVDSNVGRILDRLNQLGLYDTTLIVLSSDHGEEFWEHDRFEHGHSLYNEVVHVPLLVKLPSAQPQARIVERVGKQSIPATILDLCRVPPAIGLAPSLAPLLHSERTLWAATPLLSTGLVYFENREAVVFDDWKYIHGTISGEEELFDLALDPLERRSLAGGPSRDHRAPTGHAGCRASQGARAARRGRRLGRASARRGDQSASPGPRLRAVAV